MSLENDLTGEHAEYRDIKLSIEKYGGFYIGRYESGKEVIDDTNVVVVMKNKSVWRSIGCGSNIVTIGNPKYSAIAIARNMYSQNESFATNLIYGIEWDATLRFIADKNHDIYNSNSWGNYTSGVFYNSGYNELWKAKNIYDLAGNVEEITMEALYNDFRVARGGYSSSISSKYNERACHRTIYQGGGCGSAQGFRVAMYLK